MKRFSLLTFSLLLLLALAACFNYRDIERNFEDAGYTYSESSKQVLTTLLSEFEKDGVHVEVYAFNKDSQVALILEFENEEDLQESLENNLSLISLMGEYEESELVKENYIVLPIAVTDEGEQEIIDTFHE